MILRSQGRYAFLVKKQIKAGDVINIEGHDYVVENVFNSGVKLCGDIFVQKRNLVYTGNSRPEVLSQKDLDDLESLVKETDPSPWVKKL